MKKSLLLVIALGLSLSAMSQSSRSADVDGDGDISLADLTLLANILVNRHDYVDLALPSGTLWATTNIGAIYPEEYGYYFAWGETSPKECYSWETYKWCDGTETSMTKYCISSAYGQEDGLSELLPEDDAAYVLWGEEWRIPSLAQLEELCSECDWTWTTMFGVNGQMVSSRSNGNYIFLPAGGWIGETSYGVVGEKGYAWSRTINEEHCNGACYLGFTSSNGTQYTNNYYGRYGGWAIRPVRNSQQQ